MEGRDKAQDLYGSIVGQRDRSTRVDYYYDELSKARKRIDVLERRAWGLLHNAKRWRRKFCDETKAQKWFLERNYELTKEWEDERDRYQDMLELNNNMSDRLQYYIKARQIREVQRDEARKERDELYVDIFDTSRKINEARRLARHFKKKYEQGAPMTIAGMNTRIAELKERNERLIAVCKNTRTAILAFENKPAFYYSELMMMLADISEALYDHIAREEDNEQKTT